MSTPAPPHLPPASLDPRLAAALADGEGPAPLLEPIGAGVWALPLLSEAGCAALLAEVDRRRSADQQAPNCMHAYGVVLADQGLGELSTWLRQHIVAPIGASHFEELGGAELETEHGFLAEYGAGADSELGYHVDDSVVTLNLCLGESFAGSELYFRGLRCDLHRQNPWTSAEEFELDHVPGLAVLHAGRHRHDAHPIRQGSRRNLILWCQGALGQSVAARCGAWCGENPAQDGV